MKKRMIAVIALSGVLSACGLWPIEPDMYQARVTLSIGGFIQTPDDILARDYAALAVTSEVLEAAQEAGAFPETPTVSAEVIENTSLLVLTVRNEDPELAVDMANEVARQLILHAPDGLSPAQQAQLDTAIEEMGRLSQELEALRSQRGDIESQLAAATDPSEVADLKEQQSTIDAEIERLVSTYARLANTVASLQQHAFSIEIVEPAFLIGSP